ncbi:hypothetical protein V1498_15310 [Peribacillus sp. SCS-26]|uniref:hypothetical protein n=1 Tax=Paraperibacillus marinus TaxID=3115295 RepID=UPI003906CB5C
MYYQQSYYPQYGQTLAPREQEQGNDERFFPLLPFAAGLAIGPLLFNRPYFYPYPVYAAYPPPVPPYYYY